MSTLFDTDDAPTEPAPEALVNELVALGFKLEVVQKWTRARAATVFANCVRQRQRDLNHGTVKAAEQDAAAGAPRGLNGRELVARVEAARCLDEAIATNDADELLLCLTHAMYPLARVELRDAAVLVAAQLKINPDTLEKIEAPR